jgi:hypothetical protein
MYEIDSGKSPASPKPTMYFNKANGTKFFVLDTNLRSTISHFGESLSDFC